MKKFFGKSIAPLGFGLMRLPQKDGKTDIEQVKKMVDLYMEAGFNYFDTAWAYTGSEEAIKEALVDRYPRDSYYLASKCAVWLAKDKEEGRNMLDISLKRTGAGYFDFYLHHNLGESRTKVFDDFDMWELIQRKKEEGLVKHVGFSIHDKADALEKILNDHPEMEFVQLQINYADWENPNIESRKCYETARRHGKPVIVMEPVKGGTLAAPPEDVKKIFKDADSDASLPSWAVRFAASLEGVMTVLSGMSSVEQMKDNLSYMKNFKPVTSGEIEIIEKARKALGKYRSIPCTDCKYCMSGCPEKVAIPGIFEAANMYEMYKDLKASKERYQWNTEGHGLKGALACVQCGKCEEACPQHIAIRDELKKATDIFDKEEEKK